MAVTTIELNVEGMTCDHCVHAVTNALKEVHGVKHAVVSLEGNAASVDAEGVDVKDLIAAIEEEGYTATER